MSRKHKAGLTVLVMVHLGLLTFGDKLSGGAIFLIGAVTCLFIAGILDQYRILVMILLLSPIPCRAQVLDPQIRLLVHSHAVDPNKRIGIASWTILPDVTKENLTGRNPKRLLFVVGSLFKLSKASDYNWLEVMPGVLLETHPTTRVNQTRFLLNTRAYLKWPAADLYLENHLRKDRLLFSAFATRPFQLKWLKGRYGGEGEVVVSLTPAVANVVLLGPRISVRLPPSWLNLATAFYLNQEADLVWRAYFKLGK